MEVVGTVESERLALLVWQHGGAAAAILLAAAALAAWRWADARREEREKSQ